MEQMEVVNEIRSNMEKNTFDALISYNNLMWNR